MCYSKNELTRLFSPNDACRRFIHSLSETLYYCWINDHGELRAMLVDPATTACLYGFPWQPGSTIAGSGRAETLCDDCAVRARVEAQAEAANQDQQMKEPEHDLADDAEDDDDDHEAEAGEEQLDLDGMDFQPADFDQQGEEETGEIDLDGMTFRPQGGHYHG